MRREDVSDNIAFLSLTIGKVMNALAQTPLENNNEETQDQLIFFGSLVQVAAGVMLLDLFSDDPITQLGVALSVIGYMTFMINLLRDEDDEEKLLVQAMSSNMKEVLGNLILLADKDAWKKMYWVVGIFMLCLGNFIQVLGRKRLLQEEDFQTLFDREVTAGTWMETGGMAAIMLGHLAETA